MAALDGMLLANNTRGVESVQCDIRTYSANGNICGFEYLRVGGDENGT
jgi:hypothetical protein